MMEVYAYFILSFIMMILLAVLHRRNDSTYWTVSNYNSLGLLLVFLFWPFMIIKWITEFLIDVVDRILP